MNTFRTTARLSLAALALVFGVNFATANDKTPAKPPVAYQSGGHSGSNVQGHKLDDAKKPNGFSFGASNPSTVKDAAKSAPEAKKPSNFSWGMTTPPSINSPRDTASVKRFNDPKGLGFITPESGQDLFRGMATGKTKPAGFQEVSGIGMEGVRKPRHK